MRMTRYIFIICFLSLVHVVAGQDPEVPAGEIEDQQVIIEKDKPLSLPKANRIYQRTDIRPIEADTLHIKYQITQPSYNFNPYFARFNFKSFDPGSEVSESFTNFIKAGYGNYGSPLVQGYFGIDYEGNSAGIWLSHESFSKGPVRDDESAYSLSEVLLDGTLKRENISIRPEMYYQREGYYFYGYDAEALELADKDQMPFITDRIVANHFSVSAAFNAWKAEKFELSINPFYTLTNMQAQGEDAFNTEHKAGVEGAFGAQLNDLFEAGVAAGFTHYNYKSGLQQIRDVLKVNPFATFQNDVLRLKVGLKYFYANDSLTSGAESYFYPDLEADIQLSGNLGVFAKLSGGVKPTGLNDLRLANRYLQDSLLLLNQRVKVDFKGGVEANLSEKLLLRGFLQYRQLDNQPLFFHSFADSSRFSVLYDPEDFSEYGIGLEAKYHIGTKTAVSGSLLLRGYETDTTSEAWYLPVLRFDLTASHTINEVFKLRTKLIVLEGIKAPDPVSFEARDLETIINWGMGLQYDFIPQAGAFIEVENVLYENYERYLNYPSRGFTVKLGFIYRF